MEFTRMLVIGIMDSIEEFFASITSPSTKFTLDAFFVSLVFLVWSIVSAIFNLFSFVSWQEALTTSIIMLGIVLVDSGTRSSVKGSMNRLKESASQVIFKKNDVDEDEDYEPVQLEQPIVDSNVTQQNQIQ